MRKMKKLLSVILMLGLVLSLSPQVFANESTVAEEHDLSALSLDEQAEYYLAQDENDGEIALMSIAEDDIMLLSNADSSEIVFKISSVEQLLDLANKVNSSAGYWGGKWADAAYEQVSDIDLSGIVWPCIGVAYDDAGPFFSGKYNGNGHKISNLYTTTSGLFGGTNGATIENLAVVNCDVGNANHDTGAIVGNLLNSEIRNCWAEGKATSSARCGGIAGYVGRGSKIENCYSLCEINSTSTTAGGIAGFCSLKIAKTEIKNCIVLSEKINGYMNRYRIADEDAILSNNYAWAGMKLNDYTVISTDAASVNGADLTYTENGLDKQFSEIFQNSDAWIFADNCLPVLKGSGDTPQALPKYITNINPGSTTTPTTFQGAGTEEEPYLIQNKADLLLLCNKVNNGENYYGKHFEQTANIDLSGKDWTPIGKSSSQAFEGYYNGAGHEITNMTVNTGNNAGLFGYAGCSVRDLAIVNCNIKSSGAFIGAITGHAKDIENCYATGTIEITGAAGSYAGGIAGASSGVVKGCYSTVKIIADSDSNTAKSSGIVGAAYIVRNCVALNSELNAETAKRISCEELSTKENNYALQSMKVNGAEVTIDKGASELNGADLIIKDGKLYKDDGTEFTWSGFDTNIWTLPTEKGELPRLKYSSKVSLNLNEQAQTEVRVNTDPQSYDYNGGFGQKFVIKDLYPSSIDLTVEYRASGTDESYTTTNPTFVGSYDVRLTYAGGNNVYAYEKEIPNGFTIKQADNEIDWFYFSSSWTYGEAAKAPTAEAQFGEVEFVYSTDGQNWTAEQPTNAGSYQIKAYVTETNNYKGAEEIKHFTINQATPTISENPTSSKISRNKTLSQSKLTGGKVLGVNNSELSGVWAWRDGTEKMSKLGKFAKTVVFTPEDKNYTEIETDIEVTVYDSSIAGGSNDNCTVSFDTGLVQTVAKNGFAAKPADPQKEGYTFNGWYTDQKYTKKFNFNTPISYDLTLYAKWTKTEASADKQIIMTIGEKSAAVFGKTVHNDVAPVIVNGRTMLPARFVAEALGAKVYWNEETKGVTIIGEMDGKAVNMLITIDSTTAYLNGEKIELDSAAFITDSRTYLPLRFICESLSAEVEWLKDTQKIIITAK